MSSAVAQRTEQSASLLDDEVSSPAKQHVIAITLVSLLLLGFVVFFYFAEKV